MGVVNIVKKKMNSATFSAMLALFMKRACSVECQRIARLVGNVDDNPEQFAVQTEEEFNKLLKIQGEEDLDTIIVEKLRAKGKESDASEHGAAGMDGTNIEQLFTFFESFDKNGDGEVDLDEFRIMVRTSRLAANLFTGAEDLERLTVKQMEALLMYDDWPTKHEGPGDVGMHPCFHRRPSCSISLGCCVNAEVLTVCVHGMMQERTRGWVDSWQWWRKMSRSSKQRPKKETRARST